MRGRAKITSRMNSKCTKNQWADFYILILLLGAVLYEIHFSPKIIPNAFTSKFSSQNFIILIRTNFSVQMFSNKIQLKPKYIDVHTRNPLLSFTPNRRSKIAF